MRDRVLQSVFKQTADGAACRGLHGFMEKEDVDTDCIEDDVANCEEDGDCNLLTTVQDQESVCSKSFAVGITGMDEMV